MVVVTCFDDDSSLLKKVRKYHPRGHPGGNKALLSNGEKFSECEYSVCV